MKANVLQLFDTFQQGGTERQAVQLTRLLKESGRYNVHVACLRREGVLLEEMSLMGFNDIPQYPLKGFYHPSAAHHLKSFVRFLREREIELVHTHDLYTNIFGMTGAWLAGVRARVASRRETVGTRTAARKWFERRAYSFASAIVSNAEAVREQLIAEGVKPSKIVVIHNGLDIERMKPRSAPSREEILKSFELPTDGRRFVTIVSNMRLTVKDLPTFLRAAKRVGESIQDAAFVLAGEGELLEKMRALAHELGLGARAFFTGRCERVPELLSVSDVCVLSSQAEGFSNSILEYMAASRAVVVTDVGGAREAVVDEETGYIVPVGDDERMAARIVSLLNDPVSARAMGERGRQTVEEKFSCRAQLERTEKLYESLLAKAFDLLPRSVESLPHGDA